MTQIIRIHLNEQSSRWVDYIIIFLLLCASGNPFFSHFGHFLEYLLYGIIICLCVVRRHFFVTKQFLMWTALFCALFTLQFFVLEDVSIPADINFLLKLTVAYIVAVTLGINFRSTYLEVMTFICAISLPCFLLFIFKNSGFGYRFDRYCSIIIYNCCLESVGVRNSGMFWEPGAFQGYIMLAPLLYINRLKYLLTRHRLSCLILVAALLTTQSTTGYIVLFCFLIGSMLITKKNKIISIALAIVVMAAGIALFSRLDFLSKKINKQYQDAIELSDSFGESISWSRMGSMLIDLQNIKRHPIIGNGFLMNSKYGDIGDLMEGAGNGFSGAANSLGIPVFILVLLGFTYPLKKFKLSMRLLYLALLIIMLNGEYFLNFSFFWSLLFITIPVSYERYRGSDDRLQPKGDNSGLSGALVCTDRA